MDRLSAPSRTRHPLVLALLWASIPSFTAFLAAPHLSDPELRKVIYAGAATLLFGGLLGGVIKLLLDEVVAVKRRREDAAGFVANVLSDLKSVYDRVARARTLIPAHRSVKTYGDEMRNLIEARVQLRNVARALERGAEGVSHSIGEEVTLRVNQMGAYLDRLVGEFRDHYKPLSDQQRGYEERSKVMLDRFAKAPADESPPQLPAFVWASLSQLPILADFIGAGDEYEAGFEDPLDKASKSLRTEHARILRQTGGMWASAV